MKQSFTQRLFHEIFRRQTWNLNNYSSTSDSGAELPAKRPWHAEPARNTISKYGFTRDGWLNKPSAHLYQWLPLLNRLDHLERLLDDEISKTTLLEVILYRILGPRAATLPLDPEDYYNTIVESLKLTEFDHESISANHRDWKLYKHDLSQWGWPIKLMCTPRIPVHMFFRPQYAIESLEIKVQAGDTVIDGGACYGDASLYFAHLAGNEGRVFAFEFMPYHVKVFRENLDLNPSLKNRVEIIQDALWDTSGSSLVFKDDGPGSSVRTEDEADESDLRVKSLSIDDFAEQKSIDKIDFIKMDIEGAEPRALAGCRKILIRDRPTLALCVYHDPEHFVCLAEFLHELDLGYRFYLRHHTSNEWETVLYAKSDDR